jgi:transcriptional regulator with XRE-family HTH domain
LTKFHNFVNINSKGCVGLNTRIKLLRSKLNLSQEAFGRRLGVTGASISKIESGQRNLTDQMVLLICKEFNIKETWLRFGEGEMYKTLLPSELSVLSESYELDELDTRIITEYLLLDPNQRKVIKDYIVKVVTQVKPNNSSLNKSIMRDGVGTEEVLFCAEESGAVEQNN